MQVEVGRYMSRSLISVVHIFEGCNDNFLDSLSILLHEVWVLHRLLKEPRMPPSPCTSCCSPPLTTRCVTQD